MYAFILKFIFETETTVFNWSLKQQSKNDRFNIFYVIRNSLIFIIKYCSFQNILFRKNLKCMLLFFTVDKTVQPLGTSDRLVVWSVVWSFNGQI